MSKKASSFKKKIWTAAAVVAVVTLSSASVAYACDRTGSNRRSSCAPPAVTTSSTNAQGDGANQLAGTYQRSSQFKRHGKSNMNGRRCSNATTTSTTTVTPTTGQPATTTTSQPAATTTSVAPTTTTSTNQSSTTTTIKATTTTAAPTSGGNCTKPFSSTSDDAGAINIGNDGVWQVRNEAWNGTHGPQTIYACNAGSWYVTSNQTDHDGAVQTYPDTLYNIKQSKPLSQYTSITSTFAEQYPAQGSWNAGYDIWMNNWNQEVMIWNEWNGSPGYWPTQAKTAVSLGGVPYHFYKNGDELMFFRDAQVKSGSADILAALKWLVTQNILKATDVPTQIEYGVEICSTVGTQTFPTTGVTVSLS